MYCSTRHIFNTIATLLCLLCGNALAQNVDSAPFVTSIANQTVTIKLPNPANGYLNKRLEIYKLTSSNTTLLYKKYQIEDKIKSKTILLPYGNYKFRSISINKLNHRIIRKSKFSKVYQLWLISVIAPTNTPITPPNETTAPIPTVPIIPPLPQTSCGNSIIDAEEECDDGNASSFDGCSNTCKTELLSCFNKVKDGNEEGVDCGGSCSYACPTNYKTGIDLVIDGSPGREYVEEYFYHDKLIDDHKVVYIKQTTPILMHHNERNTIADSTVFIGINGADGIPSSGDEGKIRFKIDQELNYKLGYGGNANQNFGDLPPEYSTPLKFEELQYIDNTPVLGKIGDNGLPITDKLNYTTYGLLDEFGDEHHSLAFWDDDTWSGGAYSEWWASDGKIIEFVVNPKTPAIHFATLDTTGQFYTTPLKVYFTRKIHTQTTYISGKVAIKLTNIMSDDPIYFKINNSDIKLYSEPISSDLLAEGENVIEYYYNSAHKKTRRIIKNPAYPSDQDIIVGQTQNTNLLWKNDSDYLALRTRLLYGSSAASYSWARDTNSIYGGNGQNEIFQKLGKGSRKGVNFALINALVVAMEGAEIRPNHAIAAKKALLDSSLSLDLLGSERAGPFQPIPYREREYRGYYDVNLLYDKAFAYDLLIKFFRANEHSGGITAIEDFKIRDLLASWVHERMLAQGGYTLGQSVNPSIEPNNGMWGTAKDTGAIISMLAMPSYQSLYYGTNGLDGKYATFLDAPYPSHPASWKDVFITYTDNSNPNHIEKIYGYPNQRQMFNPFDGGIITNQITYVNRTLSDGTLITEIPAGNFYDRVPYYSYSLMGHTFQILTNVLRINLDLSYPYLEQSYEHANNGQLYGLKINAPSDIDPKYFQQYLLINKYIPTYIATGAKEYIASHPDNYEYYTSPYGLILHDPDWAP